MSSRDPLSLTDPYASDEPPPSSAPMSEPEASGPVVSKPAGPGPTADRPKRPKRSHRRRVRWMVGSAIAVLVACGVGLAVFLALRPRRAPVLPVPLAQLPKEVVYVERLPASWIVSEAPRRPVPEQALWSHFASAYCGGDDVFRHALRSRSELSRTILGAAVSERGHLADSLACGREFARASEGSTAWIVKMEPPEDDEEPGGGPPPSAARKPERKRRDLGWIMLGRSRLKVLPDSGKLFRDGHDRGILGGTRCKVAPGASRKEDCAPDARAAAWIDGSPFFVSGGRTDLELFGRKFSAEGRHERSDEDVLSALADRLSDHAVTAVGTHVGFDPGWARRMGVALSYKEAGTFEFDEPLLTAMKDGRVHFGFGDDLTADEGGRFRMELVASRERVAIDLLLDLREWRSAFLEEMKSRGDPSFADELDYEPVGAEREFRVALHAAGVRAIEKAVIERDGESVSFATELSYDEGERRSADAWVAELDSRMELAARIVDAFVEGDRPDGDLLRDLGGSDLVDAVTKSADRE